jgi:dihydroorotate dehydrogenase
LPLNFHAVGKKLKLKKKITRLSEVEVKQSVQSRGDSWCDVIRVLNGVGYSLLEINISEPNSTSALLKSAF